MNIDDNMDIKMCILATTDTEGMTVSGERWARTCDPLQRHWKGGIQAEVERRKEEGGKETEVDLQLKLWFERKSDTLITKGYSL